jgi:hypothetical protein
MTDGQVFQQGWSLDDVQWAKFDAGKVAPGLLAAVKAAALVEFNAQEYVDYLKRVFADSGSQIISDIEQWGIEETQHGVALSRWAEMADPTFDFQNAMKRFQEGYRPAHFNAEQKESVRGSRRGEMISRCVVESGTSSYYNAIRDATEEPVLKEIAGRISADEYRHYKLFYETLQAQDEPELPFWRRLMVAIGRINESDDDELAYAFYCANVRPEEEAAKPYRREVYAKASYAESMKVYRKHHIRKLVQMVAKAVGADPQGRLAKVASALVWRMLRVRAGLSKKMETA